MRKRSRSVETGGRVEKATIRDEKMMSSRKVVGI